MSWKRCSSSAATKITLPVETFAVFVAGFEAGAAADYVVHFVFRGAVSAVGSPMGRTRDPRSSRATRRNSR